MLIYSSPSSDTDDEIGLHKWIADPTVNRYPCQFVGNREVRVAEGQSTIGFWYYVFPKNLVQIIVYETNHYAESICNNPHPRHSRVNPWKATSIEKFNVFIGLLMLHEIIKTLEVQMFFTTDKLLATSIFNKINTFERNVIM